MIDFIFFILLGGILFCVDILGLVIIIEVIDCVMVLVVGCKGVDVIEGFKVLGFVVVLDVCVMVEVNGLCVWWMGFD